MTTAILRDSRPFSFIPESDDKFLQLFSHRHDYIWAPHATHPAWQTESRHPLGDRLIKQGAFLYGVRFGSETNYMMIDLDRGGLYHPARDPFAVDRILAALEPIGLVAHIAITSSHSGGIHLYFPFEQPEKTWRVALAVKVALENAGFLLKQGHMEVFPNSKPYDSQLPTPLYQAHRLPLQIGSYLLDGDGQPCYTSHSVFVSRWQTCQHRNDVTTAALDKMIALARIDQPRLTGKASKFLNDLNADIEAGWTGHGQTNFILGRIAMRAYIFEHLEGNDLVKAVITTAVELPGYRDWCRHQHEIRDRAAHWARAVSNSRYFPYGTSSSTPHSPSPDMWNQQRSEDARERIRLAIASMLDRGTLPSGVKARFLSLAQFGISGQTLYRHRDLWHPSDLSLSEENSQSMTSGGLFEDAITEFPEDLNDCPEEVKNCNNRGKSGYKLIGATACNSSNTKGLSDRESDETVEDPVTDATARVSDVSQCDLTAKEVSHDTD